MVNLFKKLFKKKPAAQEPPQQETPAYYANLFSMITNFKTMMDSKELTYPFSGINNPIFEKSDFKTLTLNERIEAEKLIDDMIDEILFFQTVNPDSTPDTLAQLASDELLSMSARAFQNMPLYENMTIH